ncbi:MAG TPA: sulfotransferase [Dokdonella sp.]|jgi:tetratricopeptide (TPR) repeat protein|nr:sulfotransferase [Dokdonella sp.]
MPTRDVEQALNRIEALLGSGQARAAEHAARALLLNAADDPQLHVLLAHALRAQSRLAEAREALDHVLVRHPGLVSARMLDVDLLHASGRQQACVETLQALEAEAARHPPRLLQDVAQRYTVLGMHAEAERCQRASRQREPGNAAIIYNHATALIALGKLNEAEAALDRVIALKPADSDAWYNRSTLRRQTAASNHITELQARLEATAPKAPARVALGYALAKEYEDLGEHAHSFAALKQAADTRRAQLSYRVDDDMETMHLIAQAFDAAFFARTHAGHVDARPVFIVGLPRSGTTLVDRILSSHTQISSRGETSDLAMALVGMAGAVGSKAELVERSTQLDFAALGQRYCAHLAADGGARQIDKTPINFLYLGLIAAALPDARIIHVRRNPMDVGYAMYKTLFRMAYPFSYDLDDLARYGLAYDRLMQHWRSVLPAGRMFELDYEALVADQAGISRRLVEWIGMPWQDQCLAFENNASPSLTASAAQVRQPMYSSSVGLWKRYASELAPLRDALRAGGVRIDDHDDGDAA